MARASGSTERSCRVRSTGGVAPEAFQRSTEPGTKRKSTRPSSPTCTKALPAWYLPPRTSVKRYAVNPMAKAPRRTGATRSSARLPRPVPGAFSVGMRRAAAAAARRSRYSATRAERAAGESSTSRGEGASAPSYQSGGRTPRFCRRIPGRPAPRRSADLTGRSPRRTLPAMPEIDREILDRAMRWCAESGRPVHEDVVRHVLLPLGWDELLAVKAILADPPPWRDLSPADLLALSRGVVPRPGAPAKRAPRRDGRAAGRSPRPSAGPRIRRVRDRVEPSTPSPASVPSIDLLYQESGRAVLDRMVRQLRRQPDRDARLPRGRMVGGGRRPDLRGPRPPPRRTTASPAASPSGSAPSCSTPSASTEGSR